MSLHLRTRHGPAPGRALRLSSAHLLRAAAAGPPLVFLVPHHDGWYVVPVAPGLTVNDRPLAAAARLGVGDRIGLGPAGVLEVEGAAVDDPRPPAFDPGDPGTTCRALGGPARAAARDGLLLVGGPGCRLIPDSPEPVAAVARVADRWVLYALNRDDLRTPDDPPGAAGWVPLRDGDEYRVGGRLLTFDILSADELVDDDPAADQTPATAVGPAPVVPDPTVDEPTPSGDGAGGTDEVAASDTQSDPTADAARRVCAWVNVAQKEPDKHTRQPALPPGVDGRVRAAARAVLADPLGRAGLSRFADVLRDLGYDDLYRHALRRLRFVAPKDVAINRRLAEAYLAAGRDGRRSPSERAQLLDEAEMYRKKAVAVAPFDRNLGRLSTEIAAQRALALFGTETGATPRPDDD